MSEKLLSPPSLGCEEIDINMAGINYYRNGPYLAVERHIDSRSQLDLLPLYARFARSKYKFDEEATWVLGSYERTKVCLAELFLEDSVCSLDTLTFDCSQFDEQNANRPSLYTVEEAVGRIREKDEGVFLDVSLSLASIDRQAGVEVSVFEQALDASDIAYRHKQKNAAPELYLGALITPEDFNDGNVDEFLDTLLLEAPSVIQAEPFVIQVPDIAA